MFSVNGSKQHTIFGQGSLQMSNLKRFRFWKGETSFRQGHCKREIPQISENYMLFNMKQKKAFLWKRKRDSAKIGRKVKRMLSKEGEMIRKVWHGKCPLCSAASAHSIFSACSGLGQAGFRGLKEREKPDTWSTRADGNKWTTVNTRSVTEQSV